MDTEAVRRARVSPIIGTSSFIRRDQRIDSAVPSRGQGATAVCRVMDLFPALAL